MKFELIIGAAQHFTCDTCGVDGLGGSESYTSASNGEIKEPEEWYQEVGRPIPPPLKIVCSSCAAKLVQEDPTRSVSQFYTDTQGTEVLPEVLRD
jgi:hypothetical protein